MRPVSNRAAMMNHFERMLAVPLGSVKTTPAGIRAALDFAETHSADVCVYGVIPSVPEAQASLRLGKNQTTITEHAVERLRATLMQWATEFGSLLDVSIAVDVGRLPVEVVNAVRRSEFDLVVVAADDSIESVAAVRRIAATCPCPVWVSQSSIDDGRVLAAVDPDHDPVLNDLILGLASSQAEQRGTELHVVHAWQMFDGTMYLGTENTIFVDQDETGVDVRELEALALEVEHAHDERLTEMLQRASLDVETKTHLLDGPAARAINRLVDLYRIDLLVMGSIGRNVNDGMPIGSTAEQILSTVDCSVLVMKPPGFLSPMYLQT